MLSWITFERQFLWQFQNILPKIYQDYNVKEIT